MTKVDLEFYWMCKRISTRAANNITIVDSYRPYKNNIISLNQYIASLETLMPMELVISTGYTLDFNIAKYKCSSFWDLSICKIFKGFASTYKSNNYFQAVNFTVWKLNRIPMGRYYERICTLRTVGEKILLNTDYIDGGYAVDEAKLVEGMALANEVLSLTGNAAQIRNTNQVTSSQIKSIIKLLRNELSIMDNNIYGITDERYRRLYFIDRKQVTTIIHNTINLLAIDDDTEIPINKVFAKNEGATRGNHTNIDGKVKLHKRAGTNIITFSHIDPITKKPDYHPQTKRVTVLFKDSVDFTVRLKKIITNETVKQPIKTKRKSRERTVLKGVVQNAAVTIEDKGKKGIKKPKKIETAKKIIVKNKIKP